MTFTLTGTDNYGPERIEFRPHSSNMENPTSLHPVEGNVLLEAFRQSSIRATTPAPEPGEVAELVSERLPDLRQNLEKVIRSSRAYDGYSTMTPMELADRIIDAVVYWYPSTLLQHLSAPTPEPAPVATLSDALISAEAALSDIAEGEETNAAPNTFEWAEQRCSGALAIIRPVMQQHGIRTSEPARLDRMVE
jgi:hypothetical protein